MVVCKLEPVDTEARPDCSASESGTSSSVPSGEVPLFSCEKQRGLLSQFTWVGMGWALSRQTKKVRPAESVCKNDPVAGSPTTTLLRLHLPLSFKIWETSLENIRQSRQDPRSEYLTGKLNR